MKYIIEKIIEDKTERKHKRINIKYPVTYDNYYDESTFKNFLLCILLTLESHENLDEK